jgi:hypothetical protein
MLEGMYDRDGSMVVTTGGSDQASLFFSDVDQDNSYVLMEKLKL